MVSYRKPLRRPLKIFSSDPMLGRFASDRISIDVEYEPALAGPRGARIAVVDYDATEDSYYEPINLEDPAVLIGGGLEPSESDPRFHQQMVYAVAMKVLENFDQALGRRVHFSEHRPLRIFPHAFAKANAYFDPNMHALMFGYFGADEHRPGANVPGGTIFTCLSHDVIAHEMAHALAHRLRRYFIEPTNRDVAAFHEGFADIVALFQHFTFPAVVRSAISNTAADLQDAEGLFELASQFGHATGMLGPLRRALSAPDPKQYAEVEQPHARGQILVSAVFDAFLRTYRRRTEDLRRLYTSAMPGGTRRVFHPDLTERLTQEAANTARAVLTMCIRAFEYLPPIDVTFGDYLRALVTADFYASPRDEHELRATCIEAFRERGIYPDGVTSLSEEALLWEPASPDLPRVPEHLIHDAMMAGAQYQMEPDLASPDLQRYSPEWHAAQRVAWQEKNRPYRDNLEAFARENAGRLGLDPDLPIAAIGFHAVFRADGNGQTAIELVAQLVQKQGAKTPKEVTVRDAAAARGGTTLIVAASGAIRHVISKPLPFDGLPPEVRHRAERRVANQEEWLAGAAHEFSPKEHPNAIDFAALHQHPAQRWR